MNARFLRNWTRQMRKGLLELAILNDIQQRGTYAYEMERAFCKSCGLLLGRGRIYGILARLKKDRLVKSVEVKSIEGPRRKYYDLTAAGRETLAQMNAHWLAVQRQLEAIAHARQPRATRPRRLS